MVDPGSIQATGRFPRTARLRASEEFGRVHAAGRAIRTRHLVFLVAPGITSGARFGLTVSRKVGGAVVRNRVKRWLREAIRHRRSQIANAVDVVVVARPGAGGLGAARVAEEVAQAFSKLVGSTR